MTDNAALTPREIETLMLMADGHSYETASHALGIKPRGTRFHVANAKKKLKAKTRTHAVALAIRAGLIQEKVG